jgi:predicted N-formylglutamate amidohydrolase
MIEIRNDEIATPGGQSLWSERLAVILARAGEEMAAMPEGNAAKADERNRRMQARGR